MDEHGLSQTDTDTGAGAASGPERSPHSVEGRPSWYREYNPFEARVDLGVGDESYAVLKAYTRREHRIVERSKSVRVEDHAIMFAVQELRCPPLSDTLPARNVEQWAQYLDDMPVKAYQRLRQAVLWLCGSGDDADDPKD